jgi:hypothetical protein
VGFFLPSVLHGKRLNASSVLESPLTRLELAVALASLLLLCWLSFREMTPAPIVKDARETLQMAINLERHGVFSADERPPYRPSMQREPVPIMTGVAAIYVLDSAMGRVPDSAYFSGEPSRFLKLQNLLWLSLLVVASFVAVRRFTQSFWIAWFGGILVALPFIFFLGQQKSTIGVDSLCTDLAGAALLSATSLSLAAATTQRRTNQLILASVLFGILALTKAALLYIYIGIWVTLTTWNAIASRRQAPRTARGALISSLALAVPFAFVVTPWLCRNQLQTGYFEIAERGGPVLLYRAFLNDVSRQEFIGTFYAWGPPYIASVAGRLAGFTSADLRAGGRLQRITMNLAPEEAALRETAAEESGRPEDAITLYHKSRAIYEAELQRLTVAGDRYPSGAADAVLKEKAISLISRRPFKHLALMIPLVYRGAPLSFPLLVVATIYAWRRRRPDLMVYVMPAVGVVLFYAAFTHFVGRYGWVPLPIATVSLVVLVAALRPSPRPRENPRPTEAMHGDFRSEA